MIVYCRNVAGRGATSVVIKLLESFDGTVDATIISSPELYAACPFAIRDRFVWRVSHRNPVLHLLDVLLLHFSLDKTERLVVLGDVPLFWHRNQYVLLQNRLLIERNGGSIRNSITRSIFRVGSRFVKRFFVQTHHMSHALLDTISSTDCDIEVIQHPPPRRIPKHFTSKLAGSFIYPADQYPHKNHNLIYGADKLLQSLGIRIILTLPRIPCSYLDSSIVNIGSVKPETISELFANGAGLIFPSKCESYGLPLLEAMDADVPILCSDLPYTRELLGESAYYFDPDKPHSLEAALLECKNAGFSPRKPYDFHPLKWRECSEKITRN